MPPMMNLANVEPCACAGFEAVAQLALALGDVRGDAESWKALDGEVRKRVLGATLWMLQHPGVSHADRCTRFGNACPEVRYPRVFVAVAMAVSETL